MLQAVDQCGGAGTNVRNLTVSQIGIQNCDYLVIGLLAIGHTQSAYRLGSQKETSVGKVFFGEHTNVHWILVTLHSSSSSCPPTQFAHVIPTKSLWYESVECGTH